MDLCDVVAVNIKTGAVRVMATDKTRADADACVAMAVMRRGVDEEFFSAAQHGRYKDGGEWVGRGELPADTHEPGGMTFPRGPRGLDR